VDLAFLSSGATDEYVKVSAVIASAPAGQVVQPLLNLLSSSGANVQSVGASSNIYPSAAGVVNSKFTVSMTGANQLAAGTYALIVLANASTSTDTLQQNITFTINPAPTPVLSVGLSKIWMMSGASRASESNYSNSISAPAAANTTTPAANISVDLRDTNNFPMTTLPIVAAVTGPGLISIGSSPAANPIIGRAALGQAGQYSISLFSDGTFGTSTISIYQNGQLIGSKSVTFIAAAPIAPVAPSISISNVTVDKSALAAGESVYVRFSASSTSLPYGLDTPNVSILYGEDCDDEICGVSDGAELVSGDSSSGTWSIGLNIPSTSLSGDYVLTIFFGKNKGVPGAYYKHSQTISVKGVTPPPVPPATTITMSDLSLNKTSFKTGETLIVRVNMASSNLPLGAQMLGSLYSQNECEDESCSSYGSGKLISGTLEKGVWEIQIPIHSTLITDTYSFNYGFFKLKGTNGAIGTYSGEVKVAGVTPAPLPPEATVSMSVVSISKTQLSVGDTFTLRLAMKSSNLPSGVPLQATLFTPNDCEDEGCSAFGTGKLIVGTLQNGIWDIAIPINSTLLPGTYSVSYGFFKLKGTPGAVGTRSDVLVVSGTNPVEITPVYGFSSTKVSQTVLKAGQYVTGYFYMKTNDEKVSTPACIIDGVVGWTPAMLMNGFPMAGSWECQIFVPAGTVSGVYKLQAAVVGYANGNKNEQWANLGTMVISGAPKDTTFTPTPIEDEPIEDDGVEEEPTGTLKVKKEPSGKYLLTVASNLEEESISIVATKKGKRSIRFSVSTKVNGSIQIRTSRNLSGYSLKLIFDGQTLKTIKAA
jgi:hypothetical protein